MKRMMKMPTLSMCMLGLILVSQLGCIGSFTDGLAPGSIPPALPDVKWVNTEQPLSISLETLKGSPVLLEFWSSECGPCVQSIPKIERMKKAYQSKGLQVVTIHLTLGWDNHESAPDAVKKFIETAKISYPVGLDFKNESGKLFKFKYIPHAVILDDKGIVRWSGNLYTYSLEKGLKKLLDPIPQAHAENVISSEDLNPLVLHTEKQCKDGACNIH
jgi:thiol-disulfide isomerase/thioredoxin